MSKWHHPTKIRKSARRACGRKVRYESFDQAEVAREAAVAAGITGDKPSHTYECRFCEKFHWGRIGRYTHRINAVFAAIEEASS